MSSWTTHAIASRVTQQPPDQASPEDERAALLRANPDGERR